MTPALPLDAVRAAIAAEDWTAAGGLLQAHAGAVLAAFPRDARAFDDASTAPWRELLARQQALAGELRQARDEAGRALAKLGQDQRGARAWARALA
jgi:hypothetical protein